MNVDCVLHIKIQDSRIVFVTYTYRICSEIKSGDAQRNVQKNTIELKGSEYYLEYLQCLQLQKASTNEKYTKYIKGSLKNLVRLHVCMSCRETIMWVCVCSVASWLNWSHLAQLESGGVGLQSCDALGSQCRLSQPPAHTLRRALAWCHLLCLAFYKLVCVLGGAPELSHICGIVAMNIAFRDEQTHGHLPAPAHGQPPVSNNLL